MRWPLVAGTLQGQPQASRRTGSRAWREERGPRERLSRGDGPAWARLVGQYARLIRASTRDDFNLRETGAADMAQVTCLRLLEHMHGL